MKSKRPLGVRKFDSILTASSLEMIVGIILSLSDTTVTGQIIGVTGLSALGVMTPILGLTIFTENLFSVGTGFVYSEYIGKFRKQDADSTFGMGLVMSAVTGVLTYIAISVLLPFYLDYMGIHGEVRECVMIYMMYLKIELMISPVFDLLETMITVDGDEFLSMTTDITRPALNIGLSIWLGRRYGISGIGAGTLISTVIAMAIFILHWLKKSNTLRPRLHFCRTDLKRVMYISWNESSMFFILPLLFFLLTKIVVMRFGEYYLPLLTLLCSAIEITSVFESTGEAMRPILPIYRGAQNNQAVLRLTRHSMRANLIFGFAFCGLLMIFADLLPAIFDIDDPHLAMLSARSLRIYATGCPMLSLLALANSYYLNTGKVGSAMLEMILVQLICPLLTVIPLMLLTGINGLFTGFAVSPYLAALVFFAAVRKKYGRAGFPYYLDEASGRIMEQCFDLKPETVEAFVLEADTFLQENGVSKRVANRVELTAEETMMLIREKNGNRNVSAECSLCVTEKAVVFYIWDDGMIFDITDANNTITGFRAYFVGAIMARHKSKSHLTAASFNRNRFIFDL